MPLLKEENRYPKPAPFMNKQPRQAIYKKRMLYNTLLNVKMITIGNDRGNREIMLIDLKTNQ